VCDFLAHDVLSLVRIVVSRGVEVRIIHLGRTLRDVQRTPCQVYCSQAQPTVIPISTVTYLRCSSHQGAALVRLSGNNGGKERSRRGTELPRAVPITRRCLKVRLPVRGR
jgi:hypothetical protein